MTRRLEPPQRKHVLGKRVLFLGFSLLLMSSGAAVWILSSIGLVAGAWSTLFPILFTVLGVILPLLQWVFSSNGSHSSALPHVSLSLPAIQGACNAGTGTLLVLIGREFQGAPLHLLRGFDRTNARPDFAINVVVREIDYVLIGVGKFPEIEAGNYTLVLSGEGHQTNVTIQAGLTAEVDWRSMRWKKRRGQ